MGDRFPSLSLVLDDGGVGGRENPDELGSNFIFNFGTTTLLCCPKRLDRAERRMVGCFSKLCWLPILYSCLTVCIDDEEIGEDGVKGDPGESGGEEGALDAGELGRLKGSSLTTTRLSTDVVEDEAMLDVADWLADDGD